MKLYFIPILIFISFLSSAQEYSSVYIDSIVEEGKFIYRLEKAYLEGSKLFVKKKLDINAISSYIAYPVGKETKVVFVTGSDNNKTIATFTFPENFTKNKYTEDFTERKLTPEETELVAISEKAVNILSPELDSFSKIHTDVMYAFLPMNYLGKKRAYVLTVNNSEKEFVIGNDYLVNFDDKINFLNKFNFHKHVDFLYMSFVKITSSKKDIMIHDHRELDNDIITATDISTFILYSDFVPYKKFCVIGKQIVTEWDSKSKKIQLIPRNIWDQWVKKKFLVN